jgi:MFS family permease
MKKMVSNTRHFKILYFFFYFTIAIFSGFTIAYLNGLGFSATQVGFFMSLLYFFGFLGQFITGYICDLKNTIKKVYFLWMIFLTVLIFFFFKLHVPVKQAIFISMIGFFQSSIMALLDSWVLESNDSIKNDFGPIRAFGSIGWGISTLLIGKIIDKFGWDIVGILYIVFASIVLIITYNTKDAKETKQEKEQVDSDLGIATLKKLFKNKPYVQLITIFFLLYISFHCVAMFSVILIENFGGNKSDIGLFLLVAAFSEVPILLNAKGLMKRFNLPVLLVISSAFFLIRTLLTAFSNSVFSIILLSTLQMPSFSIFVFIAKYLIDEVSPHSLKTSSQTIAMAVSGGLSGIISLNTSGYLADRLGIQKLLFIITGLCAIALILSIKYLLSYSLYTKKINGIESK